VEAHSDQAGSCRDLIEESMVEAMQHWVPDVPVVVKSCVGSCWAAI
jgi:hypothetical protein